MIKTLSREDFQQNFTINERGLSLVYFKDRMTISCQQFDKIFYELSNKFFDINFFNVEMKQEIWHLGNMNNIKINSTPTLILFNEGMARTIYNGPLTLQKLTEFLLSIKREVRSTIQPILSIPPIQSGFTPFSGIIPNQFSMNNQYHQNKFIYQHDDPTMDENINGFFIPKNEPWRKDIKRFRMS
jgi:hypothetical protein